MKIKQGDIVYLKDGETMESLEKKGLVIPSGSAKAKEMGFPETTPETRLKLLAKLKKENDPTKKKFISQIEKILKEIN